MGNCAGCTNPDRRLRTQKSKQLVKNKRLSQSPNNPNTMSKSMNLYGSMNQFNYQTEYKPRMNMSSSPEDPWKSRIASRIVKKYIKQPTLRQEQSRSNSVQGLNLGNLGSMKDLKDRSMRAQSLEESIMARNRMSIEQAKEKYKYQYNQKFCQQPDEIKEIIYENGSSINNFTSEQPSPRNRRINTNNIYSSPYNYQYEAKTIMERSPSAYLPRKIERMREKQFEQIIKMFEKDAETPGYVKVMRKEKGEDISMKNFPKFQAIPTFEWFSIGKYLSQLQQQDSSEEKSQQQQKTVAKQNKRIVTEKLQSKQNSIRNSVDDRESKDREKNKASQKTSNKENIQILNKSSFTSLSKVNIKVQENQSMEQDLSKLAIKVK